jgi:hypothetical protein
VKPVTPAQVERLSIRRLMEHAGYTYRASNVEMRTAGDLDPILFLVGTDVQILIMPMKL